jgi:fatty acid desaturase
MVRTDDLPEGAPALGENAGDDSLVGASSWRAVEQGLAAVEGYHNEVSCKLMKELMQRWPGPPEHADLAGAAYPARLRGFPYGFASAKLLFGVAPSMLGSWFYVLVGLTQHAGLADNVLDHTLNSRTVYMNPVFRFLYWNMSDHAEHHMLPMAPYHALPRLHETVKHDLPEPDPSTLAAYRELAPAVMRQMKHPDFFLRRDLPVTARLFRAERHNAPALAPAE